jgi:4-amino-4-deoxy-L-arabinose transferase-like glycosyltransferase
MTTQTRPLDVVSGTPQPSIATTPVTPRRSLDLVPGAAVTLLSLALNAWSLSIAGYGNTYYSAATRSMTLSWKNFFFGAFDPGGFITVDKPPVFLWVDALSARLFGFSTWSLILPSSIAGAASVALLWLIIRRWFGVLAATIGALVLAVSPVSVAVNRLNLPEPFMVLALIGASGAVLQSLKSPHARRWIVCAGILVGIAFNIKMLAAWIPGPALAAAIVFAEPTLTRAAVRDLLFRLLLLAAVTVAVSVAWLCVVDVWPHSDRPYIGSSPYNSAFNLAFAYNGFSRISGLDSGPGPAQPGAEAPGGVAGPGGVFGGFPGPLRLLDNANGGQIGWLLPFALGSGLVAIWCWRYDPRRRAAAALFLGWGALYGAIFSSAAGTFHAFYTSAMAPGVAATVGIGAAAFVASIRRDARWLGVLIALIAVTVLTQVDIANRTPGFYGWVRPLTLTVALAGVVTVTIQMLWHRRPAGGVALSIGGLLLLPAAWSVSAAANPSLNATLPQAGPQQGFAGATFGSRAYDSDATEMARWLRAHPDPGATWQLVVPNSQVGARLLAQYDLSVMPIGGFLGNDDTISVGRFADLASSGAVRYVLVGDGWWLPDANPVLHAVGLTCRPVTAPDAPIAYRDWLYDCAGRADALRREAPESATSP